MKSLLYDGLDVSTVLGFRTKFEILAIKTNINIFCCSKVLSLIMSYVDYTIFTTRGKTNKNINRKECAYANIVVLFKYVSPAL